MCFLMVLGYAGAVQVESDTDVIDRKVRIISESLFSLFPSIFKSLLLLLPNPKSSLRFATADDKRMCHPSVFEALFTEPTKDMRTG